MRILSVNLHNGLHNPVSGGQNRYFHLIRELKEHGNYMIVLEPRERYDSDDRALGTIYTFPKHRTFDSVWGLVRDLDLLIMAQLVRIMRKEHVDLVTLEHPNGALETKVAAMLTKTKVPFIYCSHNVESNYEYELSRFSTQSSFFTRSVVPQYISSLEKLTAKYLAYHVTAVSPTDKITFCSKYGLEEKKVTVIPNGCDLQNLLNTHARARLRADRGFDSDSTIIVFHGSYFYLPNKESIETIIEDVAPQFEQDPKIKFVIYGAGVPRFEQKNVVSFGYVEDLHTALSLADIAIVPLASGAGTKLKIFDYMNAGLPIIVTKKGAEGMNLKSGVHAIIVDNVDKALVDAIRYLARDERVRRYMGCNARQLVRQEYTWEHAGQKLDHLYKRIRSAYVSAQRNGKK